VIKFKKIVSVFLISLFFLVESHAVIEDSILITVGNKAITRSDIVNEVKVFLISNDKSFSETERNRLETVAIQSAIKRAIKETELERYNSLTFNPQDLEKELNTRASTVNMDLEMFKKTFEANGVDFSILIRQIQTELLWNSLIFELYKNSLEININEIDEQLIAFQNKKEMEEYLISEIIIKKVNKDKIKNEVEKIKDKINSEGFENAAINFSISESAIRGGDLGWINENIISEKFKSKIINTPIGKISDPILLAQGILLFKVRDKRKVKKFKDLEEVKNLLVKSEKTKMLNMHSLAHYSKIRKSITINYLQ